MAIPNTRLMVIGYGFGDDHINRAMANAVHHHNLKLFAIAPQGAELARSVNKTAKAPIYVKGPLEEMFEAGLIGASRRLLREMFGRDSIEFDKVQQFFQ